MQDYIQALQKSQYRVFGQHKHSAAKLCTWLKKSLKNEGVCYKQLFYGVNSHRCLQMSPSITCNQRCVFCWRPHERLPLEYSTEGWDEPKQIIDEAILAQRKLLSGFGGLDKVDKQKFKEAQNPNQAAISLIGEPTGYPYISDLVKEYHRRSFTTFIVTNGLYPERLEAMETLPTQLYVSLVATDEQMHKRINAPMLADSWKKLNQTLEMLGSLGTRSVIRITAVKGLNMTDPKGYAKLIEKSGADFAEIKSYMFIGGSRQRLTIENMPSHAEVVQFARQINEHLGWKEGGEQPPSRVIVLDSGKKEMKINGTH